MKNGDRLTGDVQRLETGRLLVKTEYAGVVSLDWKQVESVTSAARFQVEFDSGMNLLGVLQRSNGAVRVIAGMRAVSLSPATVVSMQRQEGEGASGFLGGLEGSAEIGYSLARGNSSLSQSSLNVEARHRTDRYKAQLTLASLFARQTGAETTSRHAANLRWDYFMSPRSFAFTLTGFERDDRQLLNLRSNVGGGFGWRILRSERTDLSLLGGFNYVNENFRRSEAAEQAGQYGSTGEGLVGLDLEKAGLGRVQFSSKLSLHPSLIEQGRYRVSFDAGMRVPVVSRFTWGVRLFDRFDSRPPQEVRQNDYGVISSIGVSF
jgi:putative salt-induced outer membrane protein YdiY